MPPKKTETATKSEGAAAPKTTSKSGHASYQDMITDAIIQLKDRNGSSRQALKKYVKKQNTINVPDAMFDSLFNKALKNGVAKGVFEQPKGPSGGTKLAKKTAAKPAAPKKAAAPKKEAEAKKEPKEAEAKEPKEKKAAAPKKAAPKKEAAEKPAAAKKEIKEKVTKEKKPAAPKEKKAAAPKKVCEPGLVE
ncbi:linker histone H1 and H5 family-domain-containing protein [Diplogelasinospora grovesii]|uniref:Histone H1 n=1 Tax=Diplogelasinospora grovesii TaxID=303347 RepID=A0AAN6NA64_9PEZI|nr:linker histone H1 and H5 family-domain-containing protein [Diplogelasinospora grovesii]